jgi:hypothetical protein
MEEIYILQLAIEALKNRRAEVELEIEAIQMIRKVAISASNHPAADHPDKCRRSKKTGRRIAGMKE